MNQLHPWVWGPLAAWIFIFGVHEIIYNIWQAVS
jgi:hypothetical protein